MNVSSVTSVSAMNAAQARLDASAHNVANAQTPGFQRERVVAGEQAEGGVTVSVTREPAQPSGTELATDLVEQLAARNAFLANLATFRTQDRMAGALIDARA